MLKKILYTLFFLPACLLFLSSCNNNKSGNLPSEALSNTQDTLSDKEPIDVSQDTLDVEQDTLDVEQETVEVEKQEHPWVNLYTDEGSSILPLAAEYLQVPESQAIEKMQKNMQLKVKPESWGKVMTVIMENSTLKSYIDPIYKQRLKENGGLGVVYITYVSPNPLENGATNQGNYYSVSIGENYPERVTNLEHVIFDLVAMKAYVADPVEGGYILLDIPQDKLDSLKDIVVK